MFYFIIGKDASELLICKLRSAIDDHRFQDSKMGEDVSPYELPSLCYHDGG